MLSIMPNREFAVKCVEDGRLTRKYKLKVMMMYEPKVDDVFQRAKNILIGKPLEKHEEWCKINKIKLPEGINVLHSDFPLQEQVLIEPKKIPLPPAPASTVEETIKMKEAEEYEALKPMIEERKAKFLEEKHAFTSNKVIMDRSASNWSVGNKFTARTLRKS